MKKTKITSSKIYGKLKVPERGRLSSLPDEPALVRLQAQASLVVLLPDLGDCLRIRQWTLATAESCTGGLVAAALTKLAGASDYFMGGVVSYTNIVKQNLLDVDPEVLVSCGAVSEPVARAMAQGVARRLGSQAAIGITGIAGPSSDQTAKPVGLVYTSFICPEGLWVEKHNFAGDRDSIRCQSVAAALRQALKHLMR